MAGEVIIDDIDVSKCPFFDIPFGSCFGDHQIEDKQFLSFDCRDNKDCHFKRAVRAEEKLKNLTSALNNLVPILEHYANTTIGEKQTDGTYKFIYSKDQLGNELCITYDPTKAIKGLDIINKIKEVK